MGTNQPLPHAFDVYTSAPVSGSDRRNPEGVAYMEFASPREGCRTSPSSVSVDLGITSSVDPTCDLFAARDIRQTRQYLLITLRTL